VREDSVGGGDLLGTPAICQRKGLMYWLQGKPGSESSSGD